MALKLPDSAVPMGDFPVAKAVDIDFDDGENLQEKLDNGTLGGGVEGVKTYTSLDELGLTAPVSVGEIFNAMPNKTVAILTCEAKDDTEGTVNISDIPESFGVLTIKKNEKGRFSIEYQNSLQGSSCDVKRWIGTLKGLDGTGLVWKQLITENSKTDPYSCSGYTALTGTEDLFTLSCGHYVSEKADTTYNYPVTDSVNFLAHIYVLGHLNDPANNQGYRIILYFDNKDRMYRINEWWGKFDHGWQKIQTGNWNIITADTITKYGTEILKYPVGTWRIDNVNLGKQFTDLPLTEMAGIIEIDSIQPNKSPYEHGYAYRNYTIRDALTSNIYIRTLNSGTTVGTMHRDTGWKKVCTDETRLTTVETRVNELFQSVSDGKTLVANAITGKGVSTSTTATFATMATNIGKISGGYKEETKVLIVTSNTTGIEALPFTFSANVIAVKEIVAPSESCYMVPQTSKNVFTINGKELILYVSGSGTWKVTAIVN